MTVLKHYDYRKPIIGQRLLYTPFTADHATLEQAKKDKANNCVVYAIEDGFPSVRFTANGSEWPWRGFGVDSPSKQWHDIGPHFFLISNPTLSSTMASFLITGIEPDLEETLKGA